MTCAACRYFAANGTKSGYCHCWPPDTNRLPGEQFAHSDRPEVLRDARACVEFVPIVSVQPAETWAGTLAKVVAYIAIVVCLSFFVGWCLHQGAPVPTVDLYLEVPTPKPTPARQLGA